MTFKQILRSFKDVKIDGRNFNSVCNRIITETQNNVGHSISQDYSDKVKNVIIPDMTQTKLKSMIRNAVFNSTDSWTTKMSRKKKDE